jgi:biotin carboxyl carrier protein
MSWVVSLGKTHIDLAELARPDNLTSVGENAWQVEVDGQTAVFSLLPTSQGIELWWQGQPYSIHVEPEWMFQFRSHFEVKQQQSSEGHSVSAHMPGLVTQVFVEEGQAVVKGESLIVLEAMKMENELRAPQAGVVGDLNAKVGDEVKKGQLLCLIVPEDEGNESDG